MYKVYWYSYCIKVNKYLNKTNNLNDLNNKNKKITLYKQNMMYMLKIKP